MCGDDLCHGVPRQRPGPLPITSGEPSQARLRGPTRSASHVALGLGMCPLSPLVGSRQAEWVLHPSGITGLRGSPVADLAGQRGLNRRSSSPPYILVDPSESPRFRGLSCCFGAFRRGYPQVYRRNLSTGYQSCPMKHYAGEHAPPREHAGSLGPGRLAGVAVPCAALPQPWRSP